MESRKHEAQRKNESACIHWLVRWYKSILLVVSATAMVAGVLIESGGGLLILIGFVVGVMWILEVQKQFHVEPSESTGRKRWWQYRRAEKKGFGYDVLVVFLGIVAFLLLASSGILPWIFWLYGFILGGISRLLY